MHNGPREGEKVIKTLVKKRKRGYSSIEEGKKKWGRKKLFSKRGQSGGIHFPKRGGCSAKSEEATEGLKNGSESMKGYTERPAKMTPVMKKKRWRMSRERSAIKRLEPVGHNREGKKKRVEEQQRGSAISK